MTKSIDRRAFLQRAAALSVALPNLRMPARRAPLILRVALIDSGDGAAARRLGAAMGVNEAKRSAALFGGDIVLTVVSAAAIAREPLTVNAILGGGSRDECLGYAGVAAKRGALFVNVGCTDDALRGADCAPLMFHAAPSDAMLSDAMRLAHGGDGAHAAAWDPALEKFGADTLNDRFRVETKTGMTQEAWLAWVAVKILWESVLRARSVAGDALAAHLVKETTQFDGHKGRPLSFRAWDHQLRQPLYVVTPAASGKPAIVEEPPARDDEPSREALDRLGTTAAQTACRLRS
ncbi:MAG TPA: hypothetical protein VN706_10900 [Gemmatimonadaceae bacterium]|nr:hypothetical protein [Gemmatimonadaceae bacterium]